MRSIAIIPCLSLALAGQLHADEKDDLIAKQKMTLAETLKKLNLDKPAVVESTQLLLAGPFPEEKLKSWGESIQKQYALALKGLKFEPTDNPPKGKIAVYFFPERKQFTAFVGEIINDRIDKDVRGYAAGGGDAPFVAVSVFPGDKPTDLDVEASAQLAALLLQNKAGNAVVPGWMKEGFARSVQLRANASAAGTDRGKLRTWLAARGKYKVADAWSPATPPDDRKLLAASLMEYFVFGSGAANYKKILGGLISPDGIQKPTIDMALASAELKSDDLDKAWKKWVLTGK